MSHRTTRSSFLGLHEAGGLLFQAGIGVRLAGAFALTGVLWAAIAWAITA